MELLCNLTAIIFFFSPIYQNKSALYVWLFHAEDILRLRLRNEYQLWKWTDWYTPIGYFGFVYQKNYSKPKTDRSFGSTFSLFFFTSINAPCQGLFLRIFDRNFKKFLFGKPLEIWRIFWKFEEIRKWICKIVNQSKWKKSPISVVDGPILCFVMEPYYGAQN